MINTYEDFCQQLIKAIHRADTETVTLLLRRGVSPNCLNGEITPLEYACIIGELASVRILLEAGGDPNFCSPDGGTALLAAVDDGYTEIAEELIVHGADVNYQDEDGSTALMCASSRGWAETVALLLRRGADAAITDSEGFTALDWAEGEGEEETAEILRQHQKR